jgi:palmitoyltransferase
VEYLLNPPENVKGPRIPQRIGLGIALPIVYFCLLLPVAVSYFRLLYIVTFNPGLTDQRHPPRDPSQKAPDGQNQTVTTRSCTRTTIADYQDPIELDREGILKGRVPAPPGIEEYYTKDVFQCDANGLPRWCQACSNWKPDRSHHCSDIGRCCLKMDHFCPWVGGVVGENGHKFFVQFTTYTTIFTAYLVAVMAFFVAESKHDRGTVGNVHWAVVLGLAAFFCLFVFGLALTSTHLALRNVTTIENIDVNTATYFLAVLLPPELQHEQNLQFPPPASLSRHTTPPSRSGDSTAPFASEIDDPAHASYFTNTNPLASERSSRPRKRSRDDPAAKYWHGTITYPLYVSPDRPPLPAPESRTFAIIRTPEGMNPWNLGAYYNFTSVFGTGPHHWLLPVAHSPCTKHESAISFYAMGWEFEQLLEDARLVQPPDFIKRARRRGSSVGGKSARKKRVKKLDDGWQNGERPPGWELEKEARRIRRMERERERERERWNDTQRRDS